MRTAHVPLALVVLHVVLSGHPAATLAREYYVSNSGNDNSSGTRPAEAWRSVAKVNRSRFSPGDVVRFERGSVWREQLVPHSGGRDGHVTYTSYGAGPKPLLLGSIEKNKAGDWSRVAANIWSTGPFPQDVGNIIFNNGELCGIKVWKGEDLNRPNTFWYDRAGKAVRMFSRQNPAALYEDIECAVKRHIISQGGRSYVIYDGLHLAYGGAHGIGGGGTHHIIVRNCDLCFIGGGHQHSRKTKTGWRHVRYGNGVEFWADAHDHLVENCRIWDIYDAGLTNQGGGKNSQYNIRYRNNVVWNCEYSFEYWNRPASSTTRDIYFENNVCLHAGRGWSHSQRPWPAGVHLMFFSNTAKTRNFCVRNNVFHRAEHSAMNVRPDQWNGIDQLVLENNVYCQAPESVLVWWGRKSCPAGQFEAYRKDTGKDARSALVRLTGIRLEPAGLELAVGDLRRIRVAGRYSGNRTVDVTNLAAYASSNRRIATVNVSGVVKGLRAGKAAITAVFEEATATAVVTVGR